jgi:hypothetical protein
MGQQQNSTETQGILSRETMFALKHTILTLCALSEYLLTSLHFKYVLLGKFQTDNLEFRFGQYRQMSGTNYNVSVTQIMESEKKLKILSVLKVISGNDCEITLREFVAGCQTGQSEIEFTDQSANQLLSPFMSVLTDSDDFVISKTEMSALVFIAGYVGYKLKAKIACIDCRVEMLTERALECDFPVDASFDYMSRIDRGRLTWPTELLVDIVVQTIVVFKCLISTNYHKLFSRAQKQRTILAQLAVKRCEGIIDLQYLKFVLPVMLK